MKIIWIPDNLVSINWGVKTRLVSTTNEDGDDVEVDNPIPDDKTF